MATPLKSRKKLFETLQTVPGAVLPTKPEGFLNETYGSKSMIYPRFGSVADRLTGEVQLENAGFKVNKNYHPGSATTEVQVSYFKGWHWDE